MRLRSTQLYLCPAAAPKHGRVRSRDGGPLSWNPERRRGLWGKGVSGAAGARHKYIAASELNRCV